MIRNAAEEGGALEPIERVVEVGSKKKKKLDRKDEKRPQPRKIQKKKLCSALSRWACNCAREDPAFFTEMASGQTPRYLWIGCSDSRVPANQIMNL